MRWFTFAMICMFAGAGSLRAQDDIYERGKEKPIKGIVAKESAKGVQLKDGTFILAEKIDDILYDLQSSTQIRINTYRPAFQAERDSLDPTKGAKHKALVAESIKKYQETLAAAAVKEPMIKQHAEYKIAALLARQAAEGDGSADAAIDALKKYKGKHPDSWQIGAALQTLGRLQLDAKDFAGASETFSELAKAGVAEDIKREAQLQSVNVAIRAGKTAEASTMLDGLLKSLPTDGRHHSMARVAQAELLVAAGKADEATKILRGVLKETSDKALKAMAYNTLGQCLFEKDDFKGARWEFLWVDVVYNQDKNQHAKALYYLSQTFEKLGDAERAQECRETLLNDRNFAGSEWRARAAKESKTP